VPQERAAATAAGTSPPPLKARVELGPGVYVRARVPDTSRICLAVGLGFHLELTLEEADRAIDLRVAAAQRAADAALDRCASIRANLKFVTEAIRQLLDLP
jgi:prefoldin subunit 5